MKSRSDLPISHTGYFPWYILPIMMRQGNSFVSGETGSQSVCQASVGGILTEAEESQP